MKTIRFATTFKLSKRQSSPEPRRVPGCPCEEGACSRGQGVRVGGYACLPPDVPLPVIASGSAANAGKVICSTSVIILIGFLKLCALADERPGMTSKTHKVGAPFLPYRRILPEGFICPGPERLREDMRQAEPIAESDQILRSHFAAEPHTLVDSGGYVFYDPDDLVRRRVRPDVYVVFGVDAESIFEREGYVIHEAGKPPDFALEVASISTRRRDMGPKRVLYAQIGIGEYWRFDPTGGRHYGYALAGDLLVDGSYQTVELREEDDGTLWGYSPALDLCLCVKDRRLMYYDRKMGEYLLSLGEERAARLAAEVEVDRLREELLRLREQ
jgi:hypothetical protein